MIPNSYKLKVRDSILESRSNFGGTDEEYSLSLELNAAVYSRLKSGEVEKIISEGKWLQLGRQLNISTNEKKRVWNIARNYVYTEIESMIIHCKFHSQSKLMVDECGIGKTKCLKTIAANTKNVFYIDCSQYKSKYDLVREMARAIGVDSRGSTRIILKALKRQLNLLETPVFILDEFGDVSKPAILFLKEMWNSSEGNCGWFMTGADGLESMLDSGIKNKKVGFAEIFSRFAGHVITLQPEKGTDDYKQFWYDLYMSVAKVNVLKQPEKIEKLVAKCMKITYGYRKDLRTITDLIIQNDL
jgi:hypothetical protein